MQNIHKHSFLSNVTTLNDSATSLEAYAKRAIECGHQVFSTCEHGWQSNVYYCNDIAEQYGLKLVISSEIYWVKDNQEKDRTNCHMLLVCKTNDARKVLNRVLSDANEFGYYYKARLGLKEILSLPPEEFLVTSACIGGWLYDDADDIWLKIANHFGENFMFEIQNHPVQKQIDLNKRIMNLSQKTWNTINSWSGFTFYQC